MVVAARGRAALAVAGAVATGVLALALPPGPGSIGLPTLACSALIADAEAAGATVSGGGDMDRCIHQAEAMTDSELLELAEILVEEG